MRRYLLALFVIGCGAVRFTEPNPPALFRSTAKYATSAVSEPEIWLTVLDLFAEDAASCDAARSWTLQMVRDAMPSGPARTELADVDLSPSCTQDPARTLDEAAVRQEIRNGLAAFPSAHPKALIVYANDIDLHAPAQIAAALQDLRADALVWTVARSQVNSQIAADAFVQWTFAQDPSVAQAVAATGTAIFPLQSDVFSLAAMPILGRDDLPRALFLKFCSEDGPVQLANLASDGSTTPVVQAQPPAFTARFMPRYSVPKHSYTPLTASVEVEGCSANCDRYVTGSSGDLQRWNTTRGCLLGAR